MENLELLKSELAMYGIKVNGDHAITYRGIEEIKMPIGAMIVHLQKEVSHNKEMFFTLWSEVDAEFRQFRFNTSASNSSTKRMFSNSIKRLYKFSTEIRRISSHSRVLKLALNCDINVFGEKFMNQIIDFGLGINWVDNLVRSDLYRIQLLKYYGKHHGISLAQISSGTDVSGVQGPWSNLDIPMRERVWSWAEDAEDFEESTKKKQNQQRYQLPETYNSPGEFEQGFYWRELRNDPYDMDDDSENPYPHRDLLYRKP